MNVNTENIPVLTQLYLDEIRKVPALTETEKEEMIERTVAGDLEAAERLVWDHLEMVIPIAREFLNRGMCYLDLLEEGNNGLKQAVLCFDWTGRRSFKPYAAMQIRRRIRTALSNSCVSVPIPLNVIEQAIRRRQERRAEKIRQFFLENPDGLSDFSENEK